MAATPSHDGKPTPLVYVTSESDGIQRLRRGARGFSYRDSNGRAVRDTATLTRIRSLAIPPAWTDFWICVQADGHLQATGRDAHGRKQHRYHPDFRQGREAAKFDRLIDFAQTLPAIRAQVGRDTRKRGLPREKVVTTVVHLLDTTLIRIGNDEYARANRSYGLTTLKDQHARINGEQLRFVFTGKSGKTWRLTIKDQRIAKVVKQAQDLPGQRLFQYVDSAGERQHVTSTDVNAYLRGMGASTITAKEFRTWGASVIAAAELDALGSPASKSLAKANIKQALEHAAQSLGNTPMICRKSYVHPDIIEAYLSGDFALRPARKSGLSDHEAAVLAFLTRRARARKRQRYRPLKGATGSLAPTTRSGSSSKPG